MDKPSGKISRVEMEIALDQIQESMPAMIRKAGLDAQLLKAKYEALVAEGFTEAQALELTKGRPLYE